MGPIPSHTAIRVNTRISYYTMRYGLRHTTVPMDGDTERIMTLAIYSPHAVRLRWMRVQGILVTYPVTGMLLTPAATTGIPEVTEIFSSNCNAMARKAVATVTEAVNEPLFLIRDFQSTMCNIAGVARHTYLIVQTKGDAINQRYKPLQLPLIEAEFR